MPDINDYAWQIWSKDGNHVFWGINEMPDKTVRSLCRKMKLYLPFKRLARTVRVPDGSRLIFLRRNRIIISQETGEEERREFEYLFGWCDHDPRIQVEQRMKVRSIAPGRRDRRSTV